MTEKNKEELDKQRKEDEEFDEFMDEAARRAALEEIKKHHQAGRATTHEDKGGLYKRYPDGKKVYIKKTTGKDDGR